MHEPETSPQKEPPYRWGAREIGLVIGLGCEQAKYLIRIGALTPHKIGRRYFMTDAEIHQQLLRRPK